MRFAVASPCKRSWSKMTGDETVRFCGDCKLNVYNLSVLSQAEITELVKQKEGKLCVRFFTRPDGTVLTRDCPVGVSRKRRTYAASLAAIAGLFTAPVLTETYETHRSDEPALASVIRGIRNVGVRLGIFKRPQMMGQIMAIPPPLPPVPVPGWNGQTLNQFKEPGRP